MVWFIALAVAIALVLSTRPAETQPLDPNPSSSFRIVALGDSYISGQGADNYFPGTDETRNQCHRAATAHPWLVANKLDVGLTFIACSGARTWDVTGQDASGRSVAGRYPLSDKDVFGARPQLEDLKGVPHPAAVLLSIGGNDAGFAEIGLNCAFPLARDCRHSADYWIRRLDTDVYPALLRTYRAVRSAARGAEVFVVTYPNPLGPRFCHDIALDEPEWNFVSEVFIGRLNELIESAARVARVRVIDLTNALNGYRLCELPLPKAAVNFIRLGRTSGTTIRLTPKGLASLAAGTFHPNPLGHELISAKVLPELEALMSDRLEPPPPPRATEPPPFVAEEIGDPPVGPRTFPPGTPCSDGQKFGSVTLISAKPDIRTVELSGLRPRSIVCYRSYRASWQSKRANPAGIVRVPVKVQRKGIGSINEILAEEAGGVWKKVVVSQLDEAD